MNKSVTPPRNGCSAAEGPTAGISSHPACRAGWLGAVKSDVLASVVVFLVALPLCMGIAQACGSQDHPIPPALGILTGILGGLVVGFLAGCPLQVSGPAAGLVVTVYAIVHDPNLGLPMLGVIVFGAGVLQLVAGFLRLGQWFRAVSPAVIEGMLAGIGVLIFASQLHVLVDDQPRKTGVANILSIPEAVYKGALGGPPADAQETDPVRHTEAARIGLLTILVLVLWKVMAPKKLRLLPAPLLAILVATFTCMALGWDIKRVAMPDSFLAAVSWPNGEGFRRLFEWPVLTAIGTVAFVASAETLLCATAVDQLHHGPRTRYDRELAAQGVGNVLCGLLGALPMTGVIVRSAANVEAGGKTRISTILHGVWLLLTVLLLSFLLTHVPIAALAAVLVYTGYKLVKLQVVKELWAYGWSEVAIYCCTLVVVVAEGLLEGVLVGVLLSVIKLVWRFSHLAVRLEESPEGQRTVLQLEGAATFLRLPQLAAALDAVPPAAEVHIHFEGLHHIDHACLELLMTWEKQHETLGGSLVIDWEALHGRLHNRPTRRGSGGATRSASLVGRPHAGAAGKGLFAA